jgi:deoxyribodipyrimidine photo-lyase
MSPKILIYLFRSDLRLSDNPVLHAIQQHTSKPSDIYSHLLPLYVIPADRITVNGFLNPEFEGRPPYSDAMSAVGGIPRCGPHRARFLADSIWDLKESLEAIGSDLLIWPGKAVDVINAIFQHFAADGFSRGDVAGVWMSSEETTEEAQEQRDIESLVLSNGKEFRLFSDEKYFIDE